MTLSKNAREDDKDVRVGARLVEALRAVQASDSRYAGIMVQEMLCLFACTESCTMHLRAPGKVGYVLRSEEHTSELQSLMRISYADFCLKTQQQKYQLTLTRRKHS